MWSTSTFEPPALRMHLSTISAIPTLFTGSSVERSCLMLQTCWDTSNPSTLPATLLLPAESWTDSCRRMRCNPIDQKLNKSQESFPHSFLLLINFSILVGGAERIPREPLDSRK